MKTSERACAVQALGAKADTIVERPRFAPETLAHQRADRGRYQEPDYFTLD